MEGVRGNGGKEEKREGKRKRRKERQMDVIICELMIYNYGQGLKLSSVRLFIRIVNGLELVI
jgi:hypothetical protein